MLDKNKYYELPPKITIDNNNKACCCDNCASVGKVYKIKYSLTDFATETGFIGEKRTPKPQQIWLCEDCMQELIDAIKLARGVDYL